MVDDSIVFALDRRGLVREELTDPVMMLCCWLPGLLLGGLFVRAQTVWGWAGVAVVVSLFGWAYARPLSMWWRRTDPVIVDMDGIDLHASGPVPWEAISEVVIDPRRIWLELNDDSVGFGPTPTYPPWFTAAHDNLKGDGGGGDINVPLRYVNASPDEIAAQIGRLAPVPVRRAAIREI